MTLENISLCDNGNIELCDNGNISFCTVLVELTHCNNLAHSSCNGSEASIITELEASHVGKVVRIGGVCYSVATVESGTPVAVTIDEVYDDCAECCGDLAPCACPCTSWPGAHPWGVPSCGGLLDEYVMSNGTTSYYDGAVCYATAQGEPLGVITELRLVGDVTCKATANSCEWQGPASSVEGRDIVYDFSGNPSVFADWYPIAAAKINLVNCAWVAGAAGASKETGQTPVGEYLGADAGTLCSGVGCIVRGRLIVTEAT